MRKQLFKRQSELREAFTDHNHPTKDRFTHNTVLDRLSFVTGLGRVFALCVVLAATCPGAQAQDIQLVEFVWTDSIDQHGNYTTRFVNNAPVGPLFVWIKVKCHDSAVSALSQNRNLPIRFKWFQRVAGNWVPRGITQPMDRMPPGVQDSTLVSGIEWKSWSGKKQSDMSSGRWRVAVKLLDDTLITESIIKIN
jgi:hypothetical protein